MEYSNQKNLYSGKRFRVLEFDADGHKKEVVDHPGAVVILPRLEDKIILIRNERPIVKETLWELPAGTLEKGEKPLECAKRELIEETGYRAKKVSHLLDFYTTPGFCNEKMYAYVAEDLTFVGQNLDESEKIEVHLFTEDQVLSMLKNRQIIDAKTICLLLMVIHQTLVV